MQPNASAAADDDDGHIIRVARAAHSSLDLWYARVIQLQLLYSTTTTILRFAGLRAAGAKDGRV